MAAGGDRKELMKWWCYVNDFGNQCFNQAAAMESGETFKKCADDIMKAHGLDETAVNKCIEDSYVTPNGVNRYVVVAVLSRSCHDLATLLPRCCHDVVTMLSVLLTCRMFLVY